MFLRLGGLGMGVVGVLGWLGAAVGFDVGGTGVCGFSVSLPRVRRLRWGRALSGGAVCMFGVGPG